MILYKLVLLKVLLLIMIHSVSALIRYDTCVYTEAGYPKYTCKRRTNQGGGGYAFTGDDDNRGRCNS